MPLPKVDDLPFGDEPIIVWGTIVKEKTDDGLVGIKPGLLKQRIAFNARTRATHSLKTIVDGKVMLSVLEIICKADSPTEWLPIELLSFDD